MKNQNRKSNNTMTTPINEKNSLINLIICRKVKKMKKKSNFCDHKEQKIKILERSGKIFENEKYPLTTHQVI